MKLLTKNHGEVEVRLGWDFDNLRCFVVGGSDLEDWRKDNSLLPPYLLPSDLANESDWPLDDNGKRKASV